MAGGFQIWAVVSAGCWGEIWPFSLRPGSFRGNAVMQVAVPCLKTVSTLQSMDTVSPACSLHREPVKVCGEFNPYIYSYLWPWHTSNLPTHSSWLQSTLPCNRLALPSPQPSLLWKLVLWFPEMWPKGVWPGETYASEATLMADIIRVHAKGS